MPDATGCRLLKHGRVLRCLTFLLLLPETLKKSKKAGKQAAKLPVCYEILTLSLKKKMAAELFSAKSHTNLQHTSGTTAVSPAEGKSFGSATQPLSTAASPTASPTAQQNILNNNTEEPSSSGTAHPTLRER